MIPPACTALGLALGAVLGGPPVAQTPTVEQAVGRSGMVSTGHPLATEAGLDRPHGCAIDARGNLFIADSNNHRVRVVGA